MFQHYFISYDLKGRIFTTRNTYLNVLEHKLKIEMLNITFTIIHVKHIHKMFQ